MQRNASLDALKLVLAIMVVGIHAGPLAWLGPLARQMTGDGLYRLGVPAFFILNGYFFLPKADKGQTLAYMGRMAWTYVLWMGLYVWAWGPVLQYSGFWTSFRLLTVGWWHLWYISAVVMAAGIAALAIRGGTRAMIATAALSWIIGQAMIATIAAGRFADLAGFDAPIWYYRNGLFLGLPFFLIGALIRRHDLANRLPMRWVAIAAGAGIVLVLAESVALSRLAPHGVGHDMLTSLIIAAPAIVLFALKGGMPNFGANAGIYANGIYYIHVGLCILLFRHTTLSHPPIFLLAVTGSMALTWVLIKTGLSKRLL